MPKIKTEHFSAGDQSWLATDRGLDSAVTMTLDPADFTAKIVDMVIPSGTALAVKETKTVPYDGAAGDDAAKLVGFLLTDQPADRGKLGVPVVTRVRVKVASLPDDTFTVPSADNDLTACTYVPKGA